MKDIKALPQNLGDIKYFKKQFEQQGDKHILFVQPQLNGRYFYKMVLPALMLKNIEGWCTAFSGISKYDPDKQIQDIPMVLEEDQILWADIIVFPFTVQPLKNIYAEIRSINANIQIAFNVDFNFYELPKTHRWYNLFIKESAKNDMEDNIFFADKVFVANKHLGDALIPRFTELQKTKYNQTPSPAKIATYPMLIDMKMVIDSLELKIEDLCEICEVDIKEKVKLKGKNKFNIKSTIKTYAINRKKLDELMVSGITREDAIRSLAKTSEEYKPKAKRKFTIGVVCSDLAYDDVNYFNGTLKKINKHFGNKVELVFYGFNGQHYNKKAEYNALKGVKFYHEKPLPIWNYFNKLYHLDIDLAFIPSRTNEFNKTSETYNKLLEFGIFGIPVMVNGEIDLYEEMLTDKENALFYEGKDQIIDIIEWAMENPDALHQIGSKLNKLVGSFFWNKENYELMGIIYE